MKYRINLMIRKEASLMERMVYFSLNYLRYIIVLTQLVVIAVFFYRFQIDQEIIDLKEKVEQKKEIIETVLPLLNEAARIDTKSVEIERIIRAQNSFQSMIGYVMSVFPQTATLNNMDIQAGTMKLAGSATDPKHLEAFYSLLQKDKKFKSVNFEQIKKTEFGYDFILDLNNYN